MSIVRDVTDEEIDLYATHGWVLLRQWLDPAAVALALSAARAVMGVAADIPTSSIFSADVAMWQRWDEPWRRRPELACLGRSDEFTRPLADLAGRPEGIRYLNDQLTAKVPRAAGNTDTPWHQDNPYLAIDREGDLTVWVALHDMRPEHGTVRFLPGSHAVGPLEESLLLGSDLRAAHPELWSRYGVSGPLTLQAGDATVHHGNTIHGAPANSTRGPRWAYICEYIPGDALVDRLPNKRAEAAGLRQGDMFPDDRYPRTLPRHDRSRDPRRGTAAAVTLGGHGPDRPATRRR